MKGDSQVIQFLNQVLKNELTAVNQYFLHSRMLINWGLTKLGGNSYKEAVEEMHHADDLIQRILLLEGLPNLQDLGKLMIGQNSKECLAADLKLEQIATDVLRNAITHCEEVKDYVSRDLFRRILDDEEDHIDFIETQLDLIERIGIQNYDQSQI